MRIILLFTEPWYESWRIIMSTLMAVVTLLMSVIAAWAIYKTKTTGVLKEERDAYRSQAERLKAENTELDKRVSKQEAELRECRARTDLSTILEKVNHQIERTNEQIAGFVRFETENRGVTSAIVSAIQANTTVISQLTAQFQQHTEATNIAFERVLIGLEAIDRRLSGGNE